MKKISKILFVLLVMSVFGFSLVLSANAATNAIGDVDGDGSIAAADARFALRASVGLDELTDAQFKAADVNNDNAVTSFDARTILRVSVGLEEFEKNYTEEEQINQMQEFDDAFDEFFELEDIANLTESKKVQVIEEFLIELSEKKTEDNAEPLIDADSVWYCEENGIVYFTYTSGIPSGVLVRQQDDMLASQPADAAATTVSSFGDSSDLDAAIAFGWGSTEDDKKYGYSEYVSLAKDLSAYGVVSTLYTHPTVEDYKTIFLNKEFIFIAEHGCNYEDKEDNETYCCFAVYGDDVSYFEYIFDITMKNIYKIKDTTLNGQKRDVYLITPRFFEHYYKDKLQGSVVAVGSCSGFGENGNLNYSLARALYDVCGADIVVGFHNPVYIGYSVAISKEFAFNVLCGETYADALSAAKEKCEDNDISYMYNIHALNDPDWWNNPEPNKGNKTGKQQVDEKKLQNGAAYPCVYRNTNHRFRPLCGSVAGVVKDKATQKAVANVTVEVLDKAGNTLSPTALTDNTGSFKLKLPDGEYELVFKCKGYETAKELVRFESGVATVLLDTVYLTPTTNLMGYVIDKETDQPIEDASILLQQIDEGGMIVGEITCSTDANGLFSVIIPVGTYTYTINKLNFFDELYETATGTVAVENVDGNILGTVYLTPVDASLITGFVSDKTTEMPISDVTVEFSVSKNGTTETVFAITDSNGYFELKLPKGTYTVSFYHNDYENTQYDIVVDVEEVEITELLVPGDARPVTASGNCGADGDNVTWTLYEDGELVISGSGAMKDYQSGDWNDRWSTSPFYDTKAKTITIEDGVTNIGNYAFYYKLYSSNITEVTIPDSVTSIGNYAFYGCSDLENIKLSDKIASIGKFAFYDCSKLKEIDIPNCVTEIKENTFCYCSNLEKVIIPNSVTTIGYMSFLGCVNLQSVTFGNGLEYIETQAFQGCEKLLEIILPNSLKEIGSSAFARCNCLEYAQIGDKVTNIGGSVFYNCSNIESISIPSSVQTIGENAFENCTNLNNVYITDIAKWCQIKLANSMANPLYYADNLYLNGSLVEKEIELSNNTIIINDYAFYGYNNLTGIVIPDSVTSIGEDSFHYCENLVNVIIGNGVTEIGDYAFNGCPLEKVIMGNGLNVIPNTLTGRNTVTTESKLKEFVIGNGVQTIEESTFYYCKYLTCVTIGENVQTIGNQAFYNCSALTSIYIPDSVTTIGESAFRNCTSIKNVTMGENVHTIDNNAFYCCYALESITIPDSTVTIGDYAFYVCRNLTNVTLGKNIETIGDYAFCACKITDIIIPSSIIEFGEHAFSECMNLTSVIIEKGVQTIGNFAFDRCPNVTSIVIGEGVETIGDYAFVECKITNIVIPSTVTTIGYRSFSSCSNLVSISIPNSVTVIDDYAFHVCYNLKDVYYSGSQEEWESITIGDYNEGLTDATIHYNS